MIFWEGPLKGETKLANLVLLCWHHHHLLHKDAGWRYVLDPTTRRLDVYYHDRLVGTTHPPGRQRTEPDTTPARPTVSPSTDATPDLFTVAGASRSGHGRSALPRWLPLRQPLTAPDAKPLTIWRSART